MKSELNRIIAVFALSLLTSLGAEARVDAIYIVPNTDPALASASQFPTRSDQNIYGSPDLTGKMRFSLPTELTGVEADFDLSRQKNGSWSGTGTDGSTVSGHCAREDKKWFACNVKFDKLQFDAVAREEILGRSFGSGFEFGQRSEVARFFEGQPIGIIRIRADK